MGIVKTDLTVSADGYLAGPKQSAENPFGEGGERLFAWEDDSANAPGFESSPPGAYVVGRNLYAADLPYDAPVFVLTHDQRDPVTNGGTTFRFVTSGIEAALEQARKTAGDQDVQVAGGAETVRQYLAAGLLDELVLHLAPITLGAGERPLDGVGGLTFDQVEVDPKPAVTHVRYRVQR